MIRGGEKSKNIANGKVNSGEENGYLSLFLNLVKIKRVDEAQLVEKSER
jgi:hypothetical protein